MSSEAAGDSTAADIRTILHKAIDQDASDVHLAVGYPPVLRIHGTLRALGKPTLTPGNAAKLIESVCPEAVRARLPNLHDADFSFSLDHGDLRRRFRVNVFRNQESLGACFRLIPTEIPTLEWAGFPRPLAEHVLSLRNGMVLVTGITGSGKTTTLAILINKLNEEGGYRIITVEEPIEYIFSCNGGSVVTQREVGVDVPTFYDGLKFGLRQDPDIMLIGEIRDRDTAQMALSAAETGHLVFATLHTRDAKGAVSRFTDLFPRDSQDDVRSQLSLSLRCVVSQHLLPPTEEGQKRVLALEVLFNNLAVASAIRQGKIESLETAIQTGRRDGMVSLDESLRRLMREGCISRQTALQYAADPQGFA
jgi:twitching motility protein PilT